VSVAILARTLLDTPVMLFRTSDGTVVAMHDRCPHRFAPLSLGRIENDKAVCTYHGLEFDRTGQCVGTQLCFGGAPKVARVRTFPIVEQNNILWIWMGDAVAADPARVPPFAFHDDPNYRNVYGVAHTKCDYQLVNDNLMDLTHIILLHPVFDAKHRKQSFKSWEDGDQVFATYIAVEEDQEYHTVNTSRWFAPSVCDIEINVIPEFGKGERIVEWSAHLIAPETATSCHYFWSYGVPVDSPDSNEVIYARNKQVIEVEDVRMLEGIQARMGPVDLFDLDPLLIGTDLASIRVRRKLAKMIAAESAQPAQAIKQAGTSAATEGETMVILDRAIKAVSG
jgi:vanillate O-demethylase monooxygenase subunit